MLLLSLSSRLCTAGPGHRDEAAFSEELTPHKAFITPKRPRLSKPQRDKKCPFICNDVEARSKCTEGRQERVTDTVSVTLKLRGQLTRHPRIHEQLFYLIGVGFTEFYFYYICFSERILLLGPSSLYTSGLFGSFGILYVPL